MKRFIRHRSVMALSLTSALVVLASPTLASHRPDYTRFPNEGNFSYNGASSAQAYFYWHKVGGWRNQTRPGLEFDIALTNSNFFGSCTSVSDLPYKNYSDCGTAGVSDWGSKNFGIGTYDAKNIQNYRWYRGNWSFSGGSGSSSGVKLTWQEVEHNICYTDNPWCMGGAGGLVGTGSGGSLKTGTWYRGQSYYQRYYY